MDAAQCALTRYEYASLNPVAGDKTEVTYAYCSEERRTDNGYGGRTRCGPDGTYWEAAPPKISFLDRLIGWFK